MKSASAIVAKIFQHIKDDIQVDTNIKDIDNKIGYLINQYNCISAPKQLGFPSYSCISVNDVACHGVVYDYIIKSSDIISIDISLEYNGYYGDSCLSFVMNNASKKHKKLTTTAYNSLWNAIEIVKPGIKTGDIGHITHETAKKNNFDVIRDFAGHGIGNKLHMAPNVPFYGKKNTGEILKEGMCITIEPMVTCGSYDLFIEDDGWTARTIDGSYCAQFEHTLEITHNGCKILSYNFFDQLNNKPNIIEH